jgi:hypothetical protein
MRKKKALLKKSLFDKKESNKSRRIKRQKSGAEMSDGKAIMQRVRFDGIDHMITRVSQQRAGAELRRMDRIVKEMRRLEKVVARGQQRLRKTTS